MLHGLKKAIDKASNLASRKNYPFLRKAVTRLYKTFEPREESACRMSIVARSFPRAKVPGSGRRDKLTQSPHKPETQKMIRSARLLAQTSDPGLRLNIGAMYLPILHKMYQTVEWGKEVSYAYLDIIGPTVCARIAQTGILSYMNIPKRETANSVIIEHGERIGWKQPVRKPDAP